MKKTWCFACVLLTKRSILWNLMPCNPWLLCLKPSSMWSAWSLWSPWWECDDGGTFNLRTTEEKNSPRSGRAPCPLHVWILTLFSFCWFGRVMNGESCSSVGEPKSSLSELWWPALGPDVRPAGPKMVLDLTHYDFFSIRVCTYKYICVFIFDIEHTHRSGTRISACVGHARAPLRHLSAVVCCTLEKKRCTIHFPYMNLISNKRFKGINIWHIMTYLMCQCFGAWS